MTAPRGRGAASGAPANTAMRGLLLVGAAVLIGALLLVKSFDDGGPLHTGGTATATTTTVAQSETTTTVEAAHDPAAVKVLVLNGVDKTKPYASGGAGVLRAANYTTLAPGDAPTTVTASAVYYLAGYAADAAKIATALGMPATAAQALPSPLPASVSDAKDANVVAVVGPDATVVVTAAN